jgi:cyanate lyase
MNREEATEQILEAKKEQDLTFEAIARRVWGAQGLIHGGLAGQHPMSAEQASAAVDLLGLDSEVVRSLQEIPMRGSLKGMSR